MYKIDLKPLGINASFQGKRYKTKECKEYEKQLFFLLPNDFFVPENVKLKVFFEFGFSNTLADWDGPIKVFQDVLQKKYKFNDKLVYRACVEKKIVKKGFEYIIFKVEEYE